MFVNVWADLIARMSNVRSEGRRMFHAGRLHDHARRKLAEQQGWNSAFPREALRCSFL